MKKKWFKFYDKGVPEEIEIPLIPLYEILRQRAEENPDNTSMVFYEREISFGELFKLTRQFAGALQREGTNKGDRIALFLPNCPQFVIAYYGILMAGGICVQMNPLYVEREVKHIFSDSKPKGIIILDFLIPRIEKSILKSDINFIIVVRMEDFLPFPLNRLFSLKTFLKKRLKTELKKRKKTILWKNFISYKHPYRPVDLQPSEDVASLQYTGGTTGMPRGAMLTHKNLMANALQTASWVPDLKKNEEVILGVLPFFHSYGLTVALNLSLVSGSKLLIVPKFKTKEVVKLIHKHRVTLFPGVPAMYDAINRFPDAGKYNLRSVRACISGAAPLYLTIKKEFEKLTGAKLIEGYGLSEASPVTHCNPIYGLYKEGSIGVPFPSTDSNIMDIETGERNVPLGKAGELAITGPQVMKGYWNLPEETGKILKNGWLYTGDIAKQDEDGYFYIVDRKKDMIITKGFNVYPREVEEVLLMAPGVKDAACIGVPDEHLGEKIKAVLVSDGTAKEEQIREFCKKNLAPYKVPAIFEFVDEIPKSFIGKLLRRKLREKE